MRALALSRQRSAALAQYKTCCQVLAAELGVEPEAETTALYERIRDGEIGRWGDGEISPHSPTPHHNLPTPLTPFVGRGEELAHLAERLASLNCRLLTLTGPGGCGKTRLALQAAADDAPAWPDGVWFIPLADVFSLEPLIQAIALALGLSLSGPEAPREQLLAYLREKELLLVLDGFEPLLQNAADAAVDLLLAILHAAPAVKLLITSRQRLDVQGEWVFEVGGLAVPPSPPCPPSVPPNSGGEVGKRSPVPPSPRVGRGELGGRGVESYSAVQLFLQGACRTQHTFALTPETAPGVVQICQLVDGLPLGIELAATWVQRLRPHTIAAEIEKSLDFLRTDLRGVPRRHRSLRAVFEGSWALLSEEERGVFQKLAVFRGGFQREAAQRVAGATLTVIASLADKSLLRVSPSGRMDMHELLRQFAGEKLQQTPGQKEQLQERHCEYYADWLHQREAHLKGVRQREVLKELAAEMGNLRLAWEWAVQRARIAEIGKAVESVYLFAHARGWYREWEAAFGRAAEALARSNDFSRFDQPRTTEVVTTNVLGKVLARQGALCLYLGEFEKAERLLESSLTILRAEGGTGQAQGEIAFCLAYLGDLACGQGAYTRARELLQESLEIFTQGGDRWGMAKALNELGLVAEAMGDYALAEQRIEECLTLSREIGALKGVATTLLNLGDLAKMRGAYQRARRLAQESLTLARELDHRDAAAFAVNILGGVAHHLGEYAEAERLCQQALVLFTEVGNHVGIVLVLNTLGLVNCELGAYREARQQFREALKTAMDADAPPLVLSVLVGMATLLSKEGEREKALELLTFAFHHPALKKETKEDGERLLAELEAELAPQVVATAWELEAVVAEVLGM